MYNNGCQCCDAVGHIMHGPTQSHVSCLTVYSHCSEAVTSRCLERCGCRSDISDPRQKTPSSATVQRCIWA